MELMNFLRSQWDRAGAWVAIAVGALAVIIGWLGVSGTGFVFEQLPYVVSGGIGGLFLLGLGASLLLSADLRDEWRKLDAIERHLASGGQANPPATAVDAPGTFVDVRGMAGSRPAGSSDG